MTVGDRTSVLPIWWIDGESSFGYFKDRAMLPMPGDHVVMHPGEADKFEVVVTHRTFEQPERDRPSVRIYATRVDRAPIIDSERTLLLASVVSQIEANLDTWEQEYTGPAEPSDSVQMVCSRIRRILTETLGDDD